jgi:hypothetical protein
MPTIEISDLDERRILAFDLIDLLPLIGPFSSGLEWYLAHCSIESFVGQGLMSDLPAWIPALWRAHDFQQCIEKIEWETLKEFARSVRQTGFIELIAIKPGSEPPAEPLDLNNPAFEIVVQAVDTGFWAVTTRNDALIANVANHFKATKIVEKAVRSF